MKRWKSKVLDPNDSDEAFSQSLRYLTLRIRSVKELEEFLQKKGYNDSTIQTAIGRLIELKFLNDGEFTESWIRSRQQYKNKSRFYLSYELKQKGVTDEVIQEKLNESQDDLQTAKDFIERKERINTRLDKKEFKEKMIRLLSARGFSFDIITKALKNSENSE